MSCKVCGSSETVKAHLLPRALVHDIKGSGSHVHEISRGTVRERFRQSGSWDAHILCRRHEDALKGSDDYGVRFVRRFNRDGVSIHDGKALSVPNPKPDLLVRFAASVIWRHAVSHESQRFDMDLGPYGMKLREFIFGATPGYEPTLMLARRRLMIDGEVLDELIVPPFRNEGYGRRGWMFETHQLRWIVRLDQREQSKPLYRLRANGANPCRDSQHGGPANHRLAGNAGGAEVHASRLTRSSQSAGPTTFRPLSYQPTTAAEKPQPRLHRRTRQRSARPR